MKIKLLITRKDLTFELEYAMSKVGIRGTIPMDRREFRHLRICILEMTATQLAYAMGVARTTISSYEKKSNIPKYAELSIRSLVRQKEDQDGVQLHLKL